MIVEMPSGTTYVVIVDTRQYSGNFEREMAGHVIGTVDVPGSHGQKGADAFWQAARESGEEGHAKATVLNAKVTQVQYEERHMVSVSIWPTPGRINTGGPHRDAQPGEKGCPAYESVAIFLSEAPTAEEMDLIRNRVDDFARTHRDFMGKRVRTTIVDVRVEKHEVVRTETVTPYAPTPGEAA